MSGPEDDPLPEAVALVEGAARAGLRLRLLGGLGVRVLCPDFPPRLRAGQDMDLACAGKGRRDVAAYLEKSGCVPDKMFNSLNGDRQMYFIAPVRAAHRRHGRPARHVPHAGLPALVRQLLAHPRPGRPAAVQAADLRAERQGRARHHAPAVRGADRRRRQAGGGGPFIDAGRFGEVLGGGLGLVAHHAPEPGEAARAARGEPGDDPAAAAVRPRSSRRRGCSTWPRRRRSR